MTELKFAAIGINHNHIYGQVACLKRAGGLFVAFHAIEDDLAADFSRAFPEARRVADPREIYDDASIAIITTSAVPADRAAIGIEAMRHGKDVLTDKPGCTSLAQLADLRRVQAETGRIYAIFYSEHLDVRSTVAAGRLVREGAIGQVVNTMGLGPHRLNRPARPDWFFDRKRYGGVLTDIASHQFEQALFFADALDGEVVSASVANRANPETPGLQDFGDASLKTPTTTAYIRVDWMTPDGLPTWGDGRLVILGTEGFIELRKYVDLAGRSGKDHLFLSNRKGTRHIDCSGLDRPFGWQFLNDVRDRTETAMSQERCFNAMKLALTAQKLAEQGTEWAE